MKALRYCLTSFVACMFMLSCDELPFDFNLGGDNKDNQENQENQENEENQEGPMIQHFGCDLEFTAEGVTDENFLGLCFYLTHERKYEFRGIEDCSWVTIRNAQNVDGHDWIPYITVAPNTTGERRSAGVEIFYDQQAICKHTIVQLP